MPKYWIPTITVAEYTGVTSRTVKSKGKTADVQTKSGPKGSVLWCTPDIFVAIFSSGGDERTSRERLVLAQAELAEMERDTRRGDLIPREVIEDEIARCISNAKSRFLGIHTRAAPIVIGLSEAEAQATLKEMAYEALNELAHLESFVEAAAGPDGERMGGRAPAAQS